MQRGTHRFDELAWTPLVRDSLVRVMGLDHWRFHEQVQTRDGSIADLVYAATSKLVAFELKVADAGQAMAPMNARATRQLRHYRQSFDEVYVVTIGAPRAMTLQVAAQVVLAEPLEVQPRPEGVGWVAYDVLSRTCTVLAPAAPQSPVPADRSHVVDGMLSRLGRMTRAVQRCR